MMFRIKNGLCPHYLNIVSLNLSNKSLRSIGNMQIPHFKTIRYGKKSVSYAGPIIWNKLTNVVKESHSLSSFKARHAHECNIACQCGSCMECYISNVF